MQVVGISRYPIKGLAGEDLARATFTRGCGVPGDRRFAFGIDASKDDGTWYSSRNYLINSQKDNLLKFAPRRVGDGWEITAPGGEVLAFDPQEDGSIERFNQRIGPFLECVENGGKTPHLIDRNPASGPKGHWDFTDTEMLVVNLATVRVLEQRWGINIDPRRFRANLLIDGLPPWAEFGFYGAEFAAGAASLTVLRPARRCAALAVNPETGDRDVALQNDLVRDFGHGFLGVYARVSRSGEVALGDAVQPTQAAPLPAGEMTNELAPDVALWPKAAKISATNAPDEFDLSPVGTLPLAAAGASGRIKLHMGAAKTTGATIVAAGPDGLRVRLTQDAQMPRPLETPASAPVEFVVVSGPFELRQ